MTEYMSEIEISFEVWQDADMVASADNLSDAEHFMLVYAQDGPVEAKTAITTRFLGFDVVTPMLAASPEGEGSSGEWITHDGGPNPVPGKMVDVTLRSGEVLGNQDADGESWLHIWGQADIIAYRVTKGVNP